MTCWNPSMLDDDQAAVAATLLHGPRNLPTGLFAGTEAAVLRGLRVHANTISHARLVALEETFPRLREHLGEGAGRSTASRAPLSKRAGRSGARSPTSARDSPTGSMTRSPPTSRASNGRGSKAIMLPMPPRCGSPVSPGATRPRCWRRRSAATLPRGSCRSRPMRRRASIPPSRPARQPSSSPAPMPRCGCSPRTRPTPRRSRLLRTYRRSVTLSRCSTKGIPAAAQRSRH